MTETPPARSRYAPAVRLGRLVLFALPCCLHAQTQPTTSPGAAWTDTSLARPCAKSPIPLPPNRRCFSGEYGWVFAKTPQAAVPMILAARRVIAHFSTYYGKPAGRGALFVYPFADKTDSTVAYDMDSASVTALAAAGAKWWFAYDDLSDDKEQPALVLQIKRQLMAHEAGHVAFQQAFYPISVWMQDWRRAQDGLPEKYYGSPAPDWLDEVSGVLFETPDMSNNRMEQLLGLYESPDTRKRIYPLATLFTMPFPAENDNDFYVQIRGFINFLFERAKDSTVFASIAPSLTQGKTMAEWLRTTGGKYGLPTTMPALEKVWQEWLDKQAHPPAPQR